MLSETKKTAKNAKSEEQQAKADENQTAAAETKEDEKESRQEAADAGAASGPVVYIGPSIRGVVQTSTIFKNGLSVAMKQKVKEIPLLREMLIPAADLGKRRRELRVKGSAARSCYDRVMELLKQEGGNVC